MIRSMLIFVCGVAAGALLFDMALERVSVKPKAIVSANSSVSDARTDRVIEMLSVEPTLTGKEIGERLNVSEATGRRILKSIREA